MELRQYAMQYTELLHAMQYTELLHCYNLYLLCDLQTYYCKSQKWRFKIYLFYFKNKYKYILIKISFKLGLKFW